MNRKSSVGALVVLAFAALAVLAVLLGDTEPALAKDPTPLHLALTGQYSGTTVTVGSMWEGEQAIGFEKTFEIFEAKTGIGVQCQTVNEADTSLTTSIAAGKGPDIVEFANPGNLSDFVRQGRVTDLTKFLDPETLQARYGQNWLDWATMAGPNGPIVAGAWGNLYVDSLVWYPKPPPVRTAWEVSPERESLCRQPGMVSQGCS